MKDVELQEAADVSHPAPDRICRSVNLQASFALVDDCWTRFVFGLACTHDPPSLRVSKQQAAYLGRLCEQARQCVETVVDRLGIRLGSAEPLQHLGGDELDHQR